MKKAYHIAIEGSIGVGKTSLSHLLAKELNAKLVLEEFEENPFLVDFYKDQKRFAFQAQLFFLLSRYKQQGEFRQTDMFAKSIVSDFSCLANSPLARFSRNGFPSAMALILAGEVLIFGDSFQAPKISLSVY